VSNDAVDSKVDPQKAREFAISLIESMEQSQSSKREALERARAAYEANPTDVNRRAIRWWQGEIKTGTKLINGMRERNGLPPMDGSAAMPEDVQEGPRP